MAFLKNDGTPLPAPCISTLPVRPRTTSMTSPWHSFTTSEIPANATLAEAAKIVKGNGKAERLVSGADPPQ